MINAPKHISTLGDYLTERGIPPRPIVATYNDLNPLDACKEFHKIQDVVCANAHHLLDRMQDGPRIADGSAVLSFTAVGVGIAKLTGFRRFRMRTPGNVPGDIVYDYGAAALLHAFIARADRPFFYDVTDEYGMDDSINQLEIEWPRDQVGDTAMADNSLLRLRR